MAKISTSGIAPQQQIKSEHLTRIIDALSGETPNIQIEISGSITSSYFIGDGSLLTNLPTGSGYINTSSFAITGSNIFKDNQTISGSIDIEDGNYIQIGNELEGIYIGNNSFEIRRDNYSSQVTVNPNSFTIGNNDNVTTFNNTSGSLPYNYISSSLGKTTIKQHLSQSSEIFISYPSQSGNLVIEKNKIYKALISQTGTNDPTVIILENTLGNITWTRTNFGEYIGTMINNFTLNKTWGFCSPNNGGLSSFQLDYSSGTNEIILTTFNSSDTLVDNLLDKSSLLIELYP